MSTHHPRILIAPDKFKGTLTAEQVCQAVAKGLRQGGVPARCITTLPLADGGDGSVRAAIASGSAPRTATVSGPIGQLVTAEFALDGHTAVVEVANSCGMALLPPGLLYPLQAGSHGVGQMIGAALHAGARRIVVGLGGSASTDGGLGMLSALGLNFLDRDGQRLHGCGLDLSRVHRVTGRLDDRLAKVELIAATDVNNPLTGENGAARVYGPQKGADRATVQLLENGLHHLVQVMEANRRWQPAGAIDPIPAASWPGAGSAGGLGFATMLLGGRVVPGADYFLDLLGFDEHARNSDLVITGEGSLDGQSLHGKLPSRVAARAARARVVALAGRSELDETTAAAAGISQVFALSELTERDTSTDAGLSAQLLGKLGLQMAARISTGVPAGG